MLIEDPTTIASDSPSTLSISLGSSGIADADGITITATCLDEAGNTGTTSFTANVDTIAPSTDLSVSVASNVDAVRQGDITLSFTGPGDDGFVGVNKDGAIAVGTREIPLPIHENIARICLIKGDGGA